ncbi:MAG: hypothetical protein MI756_14295 [Chromatiales bacterium]|nr:hypothetical protein [Chromatiales bacterium]
MSEPLKDTYTFLTGAANDKEFVVVASVVDELGDRSPAQLYLWLGDDWYDVDTYGWSTAGVCVVKQEKPTIVCVSNTGDVATAATGGIRGEERIGEGSETPRQLGRIRSVRAIGGLAHAAGMGRQVYRREATGDWRAIDSGARRQQKDGKVVGFEGIDGFAADDIYAAGWNGEIWHYDGQSWRQIDSPTDQILSNLVCGGDGYVYACGRRGLLLCGRGDEWRVIRQESTIEDIWGLAWFNDSLYLSTMRAVYRLNDDVLELVDFGDDLPATCYHLATGGGVLCSIGEKDVMVFDGQQWERLD